MEEYFEHADIEKNRLMAVLSYLGILVIIPILVTPDSKFVRFHANQGVILLIASLVYGAADRILRFVIGWIPLVGTIIIAVWSLVGVVLFIFAILGIINAAQGKGKELPVIGSYRILK